MVDTTAELIDGMQDMRIRNAILITALRRIGEPLRVTHGDCYDAAAHDIDIRREAGCFVVALTPNRN